MVVSLFFVCVRIRSASAWPSILWAGMMKNAVLRSGAELSNSEATLAAKLRCEDVGQRGFGWTKNQLHPSIGGGERRSRISEGDILKNAALRSGADFGNSEHSFGLRLVAVRTFISRAGQDAPKISFIRRAAAENRGGFGRLHLPSACSPVVFCLCSGSLRVVLSLSSGCLSGSSLVLSLFDLSRCPPVLLWLSSRCPLVVLSLFSGCPLVVLQLSSRLYSRLSVSPPASIVISCSLLLFFVSLPLVLLLCAFGLPVHDRRFVGPTC